MPCFPITLLFTSLIFLEAVPVTEERNPFGRRFHKLMHKGYTAQPGHLESLGGRLKDYQAVKKTAQALLKELPRGGRLAIQLVKALSGASCKRNSPAICSGFFCQYVRLCQAQGAQVDAELATRCLPDTPHEAIADSTIPPALYKHCVAKDGACFCKRAEKYALAECRRLGSELDDKCHAAFLTLRSLVKKFRRPQGTPHSPTAERQATAQEMASPHSAQISKAKGNHLKAIAGDETAKNVNKARDAEVAEHGKEALPAEKARQTEKREVIEHIDHQDAVNEKMSKTAQKEQKGRRALHNKAEREQERRSKSDEQVKHERQERKEEDVQAERERRTAQHALDKEQRHTDQAAAQKRTKERAAATTPVPDSIVPEGDGDWEHVSNPKNDKESREACQKLAASQYIRDRYC